MKITLILFVAAAFFLYNFVLKKDTTVENSNHLQKAETSKVIALKKDVESTMLELLATLNGIKDVTSAKDAVSTLSKINSNLKKYEPKMYQASTLDRLQIKQYVTDFVPHLKKPLNKIRDIKGTAFILDKPLKELEETLVLYKMF